MIIQRALYSLIEKQLARTPKILLLYGPRQAGKTTLIMLLIEHYRGKAVFFRGEDLRTQEIFGVAQLDTLMQAVGGADLIIIDEAQRITNVGIALKLLYDATHVRMIASGSSSFDLANKVNEPLTGRSMTFTLYPLSLLEIPVTPPDISITARLEELLIYGFYPEVVTTIGATEKQQYLNELVNTYLYQDILTFETIRKPKKVIDLLTLLALQLGSEVSIQELAQNLSLSKTIVEKYLDILEKMFVLVNLRGFSRNLRKEISKTSKYYFVDIGLRNALLKNFNPLHMRNDVGGMFENVCVIEKMKALANRREVANLYFWRTYDQKEIDLIEEKAGVLHAYECKFSDRGRTSSAAAREFLATYPNSTFQTITPQTIEDVLCT